MMTKWLPIPRASSTIPWGYEIDPEDNSILLPIEEQLELLQRAKYLSNYYSTRDVADWLSRESGRKISHEGLQKRIKSDRSRGRSKATFTSYERLLKKALEAEEKLNKAERKLGGNRISEYSDEVRAFRDAARCPETGRIRCEEGSEGSLRAESGTTD